jgi:SH3 domain protein
MLPSGTALKVLGQRNGWSRIALTGEAEAWILTRYLMSEPAAKNQVAEAKAMREGVAGRVKSIREQLSTATDKAQSLELERSELSERAQALALELKQLQRTAASAVAVAQENVRLRVTSADSERGLQELRQEYLLLKQSRERDWFVAGAGVLLGGVVLGLIVPKLRFRRRRGWGEL